MLVFKNPVKPNATNPSASISGLFDSSEVLFEGEFDKDKDLVADHRQVLIYQSTKGNRQYLGHKETAEAMNAVLFVPAKVEYDMSEHLGKPMVGDDIDMLLRNNSFVWLHRVTGHTIDATKLRTYNYALGSDTAAVSIMSVVVITSEEETFEEYFETLGKNELTAKLTVIAPIDVQDAFATLGGLLTGTHMFADLTKLHEMGAVEEYKFITFDVIRVMNSVFKKFDFAAAIKAINT